MDWMESVVVLYDGFFVAAHVVCDGKETKKELFIDFPTKNNLMF